MRRKTETQACARYIHAAGERRFHHDGELSYQVCGGSERFRSRDGWTIPRVLPSLFGLLRLISIRLPLCDRQEPVATTTFQLLIINYPIIEPK